MDSFLGYRKIEYGGAYKQPIGVVRAEIPESRTPEWKV